MQNKFRLLLRGLWLLICAGTWIGTVFYRPTLGSVMVTFGAFFLLTSGFVLLSRRPYFALSATTLTLLFLTLLSKAKEFFWKEKLFFTDFQVFFDPSNAETVLHYPLALGAFVVITLVLILIAVLVFRRDRVYPLIRRTAIVGLVIGGGLCYEAMLTQQQSWLVTLPKGQNVPTNVVMSARIQYENPANTINATSAEFLKAVKTLKPSEIHSKAQDLPLPDIVLLLQESTFNPAMYADVDSGMPTLGMFSPNDRAEEGLLRVHTYGGGTWRSEFAALTGISSDDYGAAAGAIYYSAVFHLNQSLFTELKRYGYETYVLTPFNPASYNAESAYRAMGVENIRQPQSYGYPAPFNKNLWHISTQEMLDYTKTLLETEPSKKPKVVFVLTMSEHGPYRDAAPNAPKLTGTPGAPIDQIANYTARLIDSDKAITGFENWTKSDPNKRRMFVRFGDHQPGIDGLKKGYCTDFARPQYLTYFALTDSGLSEGLNTPLTDIVYLPGMIVERLAGKPSQFFQANIDARHLFEGRYIDEPDRTLYESYRAYLFKDLRAGAKDTTPGK